MAAQPLRGARWIKNVNGGQQDEQHPPVVVSQTLYRGNLLCLSATSGSVRAAAEADTTIYGVALQALTTTATQGTATIACSPFTQNSIFEITGAPATMTTAYTTGVFRNLVLDLEIPTTGYHRCDTGAAVPTMRVVGWPSTNAVTGAGRKWWVTAVTDKNQFLEAVAD